MKTWSLVALACAVFFGLFALSLREDKHLENTDGVDNWRTVGEIDIRRKLTDQELATLDSHVREMYDSIVNAVDASAVGHLDATVFRMADDYYRTRIGKVSATMYVFCVVDGESVDGVAGSLLLFVAVDDQLACVTAGIAYSESRCSQVRDWREFRQSAKRDER